MADPDRPLAHQELVGRMRVVIEAVRAVGAKGHWDAPHWTLHVPHREANALFDLAYALDPELVAAVLPSAPEPQEQGLRAKLKDLPHYLGEIYGEWQNVVLLDDLDAVLAEPIAASREAEQTPPPHPYAEGTLKRALHDVDVREAVISHLQQELASWRLRAERAQGIVRSIIYASDGCQGHKGCAHSMEPWQQARQLMEEIDNIPAPPLPAAPSSQEEG